MVLFSWTYLPHVHNFFVQFVSFDEASHKKKNTHTLLQRVHGWSTSPSAHIRCYVSLIFEFISSEAKSWSKWSPTLGCHQVQSPEQCLRCKPWSVNSPPFAGKCSAMGFWSFATAAHNSDGDKMLGTNEDFQESWQKSLGLLSWVSAVIPWATQE